MAASISSLKFLLIFLLILLVNLTSSASSNVFSKSSSSVASEQISFWSENVLNRMPSAILSRLSPLSVLDSDHFTALVSEPTSTTPDANFCTRANLACAASSVDDVSSSARSYINGYIEDLVIPSARLRPTKVDPFFFFRLSTILGEGKSVHLPDLSDPCPSRAFLPSQIASRISIRTTDELKQLFPRSFDSPIMKEAIEATVALCNAPSLKGETRACAKSLEEMIEFAKNSLGQKLISLSSNSAQGSGQELVIGSRREINAKKIAYCHETFLPFVAYFCHTQVSGYRLFELELLEPKTRAPVNTILAVCHMDTSTWPADHVALKSLKLSPGKGEVCHFYSQVDQAFIGV